LVFDAVVERQKDHALCLFEGLESVYSTEENKDLLETKTGRSGSSQYLVIALMF